MNFIFLKNFVEYNNIVEINKIKNIEIETKNLVNKLLSDTEDFDYFEIHN